jgi:hypothetical protein
MAKPPAANPDTSPAAPPPVKTPRPSAGGTSTRTDPPAPKKEG